MPSKARPRAPTSTGGFARTPFAHLLVYALDKALDGTFDFAAPDGATATLTVRRGRPAKIHVGGTPLYLGQILVELGYLTREQQDSSLAELAAAKRRLLHGQLLLASGLLDEAKLREALRVQTLRKLGLLFHWAPESTFEFYAGVDGLESWGGESRPVDPAPAIWSGIREVAAVDAANAVLDRLKGARLQLTSHASLDRFELRAEERRLFDLLLDRPHTIDELTARSGTFGPQGARLLAFCFLITKQIAPLREAGDEYPAPSSSGMRVAEPARLPGATPATATPVGRVALKKSSPGKSHPIIEEHRVSGVIDRRASPPPEAAPAPDATSTKPDVRAAAAALDFEKAEICVARNDLVQAEILARKAHLAVPQRGAYVALLAWIESARPEAQSAEGTRARIERLTLAIELDASCERAFFYRAMLHKRIGNKQKAYDDFRKSFELDPHNVDAQREIRLLEMRGGVTVAEPKPAVETPPAKPGLFDRLFKK